MSTSSTPISIPASSPIAIYRRASSSDDGEDSDSIDGRNHHRTPQSDSLADLQVGSLPLHLRRSRRNANSINSGIRQSQRSNSSDQLHQFSGPMSLPLPRAPFISSRQDMENKLSSMPEIELPGSVASTDPEYLSTPFGSLRESQFTHPNLDRWQQGSGSIQQTTTHFQPQSLPAYGVSGSGGIGSFFPESDNTNRLERNEINKSSGIGGLLEGSQGVDNNNDYSRDLTNITNDYSQLTLNGSGGPLEQSIGQENIPFDDGRPNYTTTNGGNLSSSLTALDMLTRIRQTRPLAPPPSQVERIQVDEEPPLNLNTTGLAEQQSAHYASPTHEQHYDNHADPDKFEAFDFELDE